MVVLYENTYLYEYLLEMFREMSSHFRESERERVRDNWHKATLSLLTFNVVAFVIVKMTFFSLLFSSQQLLSICSNTPISPINVHFNCRFSFHPVHFTL